MLNPATKKPFPVAGTPIIHFPVRARGRGFLFPAPIECLPGSGLPDEIRIVGYELTPESPGRRILA
jgi:hypothetical protein